MKIENTGFTIDPACIDGTSICRHEIRLPYAGALPTSYDKAYLRMRVAPGDVRIAVVATRGQKKETYFVEATPEEIIGILEPFFFKETKPNIYLTRFDNGLSNYWTGAFQQDYILWQRFTCQPLRILEILQSLTSEQRERLYNTVQLWENDERRKRRSADA